MTPTPFVGRAAAIAAALALIPGCGPRVTTAEGTVRYQGKPVVWGTVSLLAPDGTLHQAGLGTDGRYTIPRMPVGALRVGVISPKPPDGKGGREGSDARVAAPPPAPPAGAWFPLPDKLADPAHSGVTIDLGNGPADIDLK